MSAALGLEPLLTALREAGLPVGVSEVARLQQVFAQSPQIAAPEDSRLKAILRAVLVKSAEDRARFESVFEAWLGRAGQEVSFREAPALSAISQPAPGPPPRRSIWRWVAVVALAVASLISLGYTLFRRQPAAEPKTIPSVTPKPIPAEPTPPPPSQALTPEEIRKRTFSTWVPTLTVTQGKPVWQGSPALTLGILALLATSSLWLVQRRRSWLPEHAPEPVKKGPPRVFLTPPELAGPQLLEPREQEALVWGIGHFVADEPTRRLDLPATVRATAGAGSIPHLLFHQARHPREVWLWIDEAADDPAIPRLAAEIEIALKAHGLPVELALFRGVPDWLVNSTGQAFAPNEVDERRDAALVAILTDGRVLARQYAADDRRVQLAALLRSLSHWPRLAFVDFAAEPGDLPTLLGKHSLLRLTPPELTAFLGSTETTKRKPTLAAAGDGVWAAACAVAPASVDELRAFQLRKRLGLTTSPWALREMRTKAPGPPGRLQWKPGDRARLVNWLREAEAQPENGVASGSLLGKSLDFWEQVYDWELKERYKGEAEDPWLETPAHQHLAMEHALLALWRDAPKGVRELYSLYGGALSDLIERHLSQMAPLDCGGTEYLHLPWNWRERSGVEQVMLQTMKLGGDVPKATLRRPGRLFLGLGLSLGLAAGALTAAALSVKQQKRSQPAVVYGAGGPKDFYQEISVAAGHWSVTVATLKAQSSREVPGGTIVNVSWEERSLPCVSKLPGAEVWRCGTNANPPRLSEKLSRRAIMLATSPGTPEADALSIDLLDSGSADLVVIANDWSQYERYARGVSLSVTNSAILVLSGSDWGTLRQALRFDGIRTVHQVWPNLRLLAGNPSGLLRGLKCRNGELLEENGMIFVHICPGTFTMGSAKSDPQAAPEEKPAHEVTLSEFWIGRTEVTTPQYRRADQSLEGRDGLPTTEITWYDAKDFCERHGWRLPTEAEWEYAARAGTQTPWSFGKDEKQLHDFSWFQWNSDRPRFVGTKKPNPWGIYDMHGNAWEWMEDWFGTYKPGPQKDPKGPNNGWGRVVRGGSFGSVPRSLRSAYRSSFNPSGRYGHVGFRCARSPRRQP